MGLRALIAPVAVAAVAAASALPPRDVVGARDAARPGMVSFPITYGKRNTPALSRRGPVGRRATDTNVPLYNISATSYLIELSIGTPGQSVKVAIDTGSDELWVNPVCATDSTLSSSQRTECAADGEYKPSDSSSSSSTNVSQTTTNTIPYGIGDVEIKYYSDDIALPESDVDVSAVQFGVAQASSELNEGIMGLAYGNGKNLAYDNFVDVLARQGVTKGRSFSVALGSVDANNGGVIIFGGVDSKKFSGPLIHNKIQGPQFQGDIYRYYVTLNSVGLTRDGSSKTYSNSGTAIVLDTGSSFSYLPDNVFNDMVSDFGAVKDPSSGIYFVDCKQRDKGGSIDFDFSGGKISIPVADFIWEIDSVDCALGAMSSGGTTSSSTTGGGYTTALLGDTFLRSVFVVFDQTNNDVAMAPYANCGQNEQVIAASGVGNITGECDGTQATASKSSAGALTRPSGGALGLTAVAVSLLAGLAMAL